MQSRCRWTASVKQLGGLPVDWLLECVAALDRVCWPEDVKAQIARIDHLLQRLSWTIADAVEYCCATRCGGGMWLLTAPNVSYARQTQRSVRLTLAQLREIAAALENAPKENEP